MQTLALNVAASRLVLLLILGLAAGLSVVPQTFAQGRRGSPEQMQERMAARTDTLLAQLNLTAAQAAPARAILEARNEQQLRLMAEARESGARRGMRAEMAALEDATEHELAEVLTEAQMKKYRQLREAQRNRRGRRRGM